MNKFHETYIQLGRLFEELEKAHFEPGIDFGEDVTGCFQWFIAPAAAYFLEKRGVSSWEEIKRNNRFACKPETWDGKAQKGIDLCLVL